MNKDIESIIREAGGKTVTFAGTEPSLREKCSMISGSTTAVNEFLTLITEGQIF